MTFESFVSLALATVLSSSSVAFAGSAKSGCGDVLAALEGGRGARVHSLGLRSRVAEAYAADPHAVLLAVVAEQARTPGVDLDTLLRAVLRRLR